MCAGQHRRFQKLWCCIYPETKSHSLHFKLGSSLPTKLAGGLFDAELCIKHFSLIIHPTLLGCDDADLGVGCTISQVLGILFGDFCQCKNDKCGKNFAPDKPKNASDVPAHLEGNYNIHLCT